MRLHAEGDSRLVVIDELALDDHALGELLVGVGLLPPLVHVVVEDVPGVLEVPSIRGQGADSERLLSRGVGTLDVEQGRDQGSTALVADCPEAEVELLDHRRIESDEL